MGSGGGEGCGGRDNRKKRGGKEREEVRAEEGCEWGLCGIASNINALNGDF